MQQDETTLTRLLTALPEMPDVEAALAAVHARVEAGGGAEPLPPGLFDGLERSGPDPGVLILHPTAYENADARPRRARPRLWMLVATLTTTLLVAGGVHWMWPAPQPTLAPPAAAAVAPSTPSPPTPPWTPTTPPSPNEFDVAQAVVALGALRDEDPTLNAPRARDGRARTRSYRRARKIWRQGRLAYEAGELEAAQEFFAQCLAIDAGHSACLNSQGRMAADAHDPDAARALFERALSADTANPYPMLNLATLAMLRRDYDEAEALLKTAVQVAPNLADARRLHERLIYLRHHLGEQR